MFQSRTGTGGFKQNDKSRVENIKRTQDCIELEAIAADGIFRVQEGLYSKLYGFSNIHYDILKEDSELSVLVEYMKMLQELNTRFKLTYANDDIDYAEFRKRVMMPLKGDGYDTWRKEFNAILEARMRQGKQGVATTFYYTVSVYRKTYEEAKNYFITLEKTLQKRLFRLGSYLITFHCEERLKILYDFYNYGIDHKIPFQFDFNANVEAARDFLDDIAPRSLTFYDSCFEMNGGYGRILYVRSFPSALSDRFLQILTDFPYHIWVSVDAEPLNKAAATKLIDEKYMAVETKIAKQQQVRNRNHAYSSDITKAVQDEKKAVIEVIDAMKQQNMSMYYCGVTIAVFADSMEELDMRTKAVYDAAEGESVTLEVADYMQREGLNTVVPIGIRQCCRMRTMLSGAMTVFLPFTSQELNVEPGTYYGINQLTNNLAFGSRRSLKNGNAFVFGVPGSGKSMCVKLEGTQLILENPKDEFIFLDPNSEYSFFAELFDGTCIDVRPGSTTYINGFDYPADMEPADVAAAKSTWMINVHTQCRQDKLTAIELGIVDKAVRILYQKQREGQILMPDMTEYRKILEEMDSETACILSEELAFFSEGSLNMFAKPTNIDTKKRIMVYNIREISDTLFPVAISTIMESLRIRVYRNFKEGRATWIYIDEIHRLTGDDLSAEYLDIIWREFRKLNAFCLGISQQTGDVCRSEMSKELVRNSAFLLLMGQEDVTPLKELNLFTDEQLQYVSKAEPGMGLLKHGNVIIPVDHQIPADTELYRMLNTDPDRMKKGR